MRLDTEHLRHVTPHDVASHLRFWLDTWPALEARAAFAEGARWYPEAHESAHDMTAGARPLGLVHASGVLSAFSINAPWPVNLDNALAFASGALPATERMPGALPIAEEKALAIASLPARATLEDVYAVLRGWKVCGFAGSIYRPLDTSPRAPLALDRFMWSIFGLKAHHAKRVNYHDGQRHCFYDVVCEGFRIVAAEDYRNMPPCALQAACWILERGHATEPDYYGKRRRALATLHVAGAPVASGSVALDAGQPEGARHA